MEYSMSAFTEKRTYPRIDVAGKVRYRGVGMEDFEEGELKDISQAGIFLWTRSQFQLGDMLSVLVEPDEFGPAPIELKAKIVRSHSDDDESHTGYGCLIIEKTGFE